MISSVIRDNEESVGPLADSEVARLLSVLQNAEFTPSDKHNLAKNSSFRQRSLIEIAADAEQNRTVIEKAGQLLESGIEADSAKAENFPGAQPDSESDVKLTSGEITKEAPEQTIRDIASKQIMDSEAPEPDTGVRGLTTNSNLGIEKSEEEQGIRGLTSVPHEETEGSEQTQAIRQLMSTASPQDEQTFENSFETASAAFERGKLEGINEGRLAAIAETKQEAIADAKAELADIVGTFHAIINSLARPKAMQTEALSSSINAAILKLASARAGVQIDDMPEAFSDRISALATSIGHELANGKVQLNEDDYAIMEPYLANMDFEIVINSGFMRGDVALQFDGVELHDIAANRMASYSAKESTNAVSAVADDSALADDNAAADDSVLADDNAAAGNNTADDNNELTNMLKSDALLPPSDESGS